MLAFANISVGDGSARLGPSLFCSSCPCEQGEVSSRKYSEVFLGNQVSSCDFCPFELLSTQGKSMCCLVTVCAWRDARQLHKQGQHYRDPTLSAESPLTNGAITKIIHRKTLDKHIGKLHNEEASSLGHPHIPITWTSCPIPNGFWQPPAKQLCWMPSGAGCRAG